MSSLSVGPSGSTLNATYRFAEVIINIVCCVGRVEIQIEI